MSRDIDFKSDNRFFSSKDLISKMTTNFVSLIICLSILSSGLISSEELRDKCQRLKPKDTDNEVKSWLIFFNDSLNLKPLLCIAREPLFDEGCSKSMLVSNGLDCCGDENSSKTSGSNTIQGITSPSNGALCENRSEEAIKSKNLGEDINVVLIVILLSVSLLTVAICFIVGYSTGLAKSKDVPMQRHRSSSQSQPVSAPKQESRVRFIVNKDTKSKPSF